MAQKFAALAPFRSLTWEDLETWAGAKTVERGRSYWQEGHVRDLARTRKGGLLAWVQGEERYATQVGRQEGRLSSACTCPVGWACKHAVAAVLQCLDLMAEDRPVPLATAQDRRLQLLEAADQTRRMAEKTRQAAAVAAAAAR